MKTLLIAAALTGVSFATSAFAVTNGLTLRVDARPSGDLKPAVIVQPTNLPRAFKGGIVTVEFSLDQAGRPREIQFPSAVEAQLAERVLQAFSQWQFDPSAAGELPAGKRFVLPIEIRPQD